MSMFVLCSQGRRFAMDFECTSLTSVQGLVPADLLG